MNTPSLLHRPAVLYAAASVACAAILAFAFYLQYVQEMEPCPLCWFQRLAVVGLFFVFCGASAFARTPRGGRIALIAVIVVALVGMGVAGRHIWIQNLPANQVPACGQGISYMLESMPFFDVLTKTLKGSGECAKRDTWLGLTLPTWTMVFFFASMIWAGFVSLRLKDRR